MAVAPEAILEQVLLGLLVGSQYALISVGLALLFGVMRITNVAHGDFVTLGGYLALSIAAYLVPNSLVAIPLAAATMFLFGALLDRVFLHGLRRQGRRLDESAIVLTLGLSILLANGIAAVWGPNFTRTPPLLAGIVELFGLRIARQRLLAGGLAVGLLALLFLFLNRTRYGLAIRALQQSPMTVRALGIDTGHLYMLSFGIAAALAGAAGPLLAPVYWLFPFMGFRYTVKAIVIVVMGGLGSMSGALLGSLILGVAESLAVLLISAQFADAVGLLVMVSILLIRPAGLLSREAV